MNPSDIAKLRAKYPISEATALRNLPLQEVLAATVPVSPKILFTVHETTDEEGLNKLEKRYWVYLQHLNDLWCGVQCITLKLAHDCRLTMDFAAIDTTGELRLIDTKACDKKTGEIIAREDALIKIRCAARRFNFIRFVIAYEKDGVWRHHHMKP